MSSSTMTSSAVGSCSGAYSPGRNPEEACNYNEDITTILEELEKHSTDKYRTKAYEKAITNISAYPKRIESVAEALTISGVGKGIGEKIGEILATGTLQEYERIKKMYPDLDATLALFQKIYSVGPKTALSWYRSGFRTYADIPAHMLSDVRKVSIQYLAETEQRIKREDIEFFETEFRKYLAQMGATDMIEFKICGSYARGTATSGDIDILVNSKNYEPKSIIRAMISFPMFTHSFSFGNKKFLGLCVIRNIHHRVDIEVCSPQEYPLAVNYFTGPLEFNILMRNRAIQLGYRLNEKQLLDSHGMPLYIQSEEHLFAILGVQYLTPQQRQAYVLHPK